MRPDKQNINFASKEVVNYSAIANKAKSLSDGIRSIDFDRINDSIVFNSSLVHNRPKIHIKPSNNSVNNVSELNFNDNSTLTGITSDSSNTDPTKAISSMVMIDVNNRIEKLETKTQNQTATANETTFTGNVTADTFNGYHLGFNNRFYTIPAIPVIGPDLVMEVGRYIDFHYNGATGTDKTSRLYISKPGTLYYDHSFIVAGGDIKARNCIADGGNLNDIASRTKSIESKNTEQDTRLTNIETKNTEQDERLDDLEKYKLSVTYKAGSVTPNITHEFSPELSEELTDTFNIKINITFEEKTYFPTFATGRNKLLYFEIKFYEIINGTQYTVVAGNTVFAINENGNVILSGDNTHYTMNNFIIEKGKISLDMSYKSPNHTEPSMWHGWFSTESTIYYQNAVLSQPTINEYFISKNLAHDNEERLTAATNKNTEQDGRLDELEDSKLTVVYYSTNASINVVCLDSLDEYIYRPRFKVSIIFEDSEYYPSFTSENTLLASYIVKLKIINNNTLYTLKKNIYSREVDGKVEISGSNMIILDWVIQKGRIDINLTDDGSQPVIILGINDQNYYPNALIQYPVVDNYLVSKNLAHDNEERLTAATNKNTEQDTRLDALETTTVPAITTDISNLQKADGILHEESVRYYDYSREHIEEIENTKIPAIDTKNNEQDSRISKLESKIASLLNSIYPVGSIYLSLTKSPPSLGGTWELIDEGKFLYSTTTTSGETGGSLHHTHKTSGHVLTVGEMPMHKHTFNGNKISGTVSDIMIYDGKGMKKENPTGCFSWEKYGSQTWQGQSSNNAGLKISFTATPTGSISYEGNNQAHTHGDTEAEYHIPPYITCFMYKRTA